jgi:hypothetical protein
MLLPMALLMACSACGFVSDETLDGPYRLVAVDDRQDMSLCLSVGQNCSGDGLPGPTVYSAGADRRFVVLARHPIGDQGVVERDVTEYYYIVRAPDEARGVRPENLKGPFNLLQFAQERRRLGLPGFSLTFDDLK